MSASNRSPAAASSAATPATRPSEIVAALHGARPLGLAPGQAGARSRDLGQRRLQLLPGRRQRRPPHFLKSRLRLVVALARVGGGVNLRQPAGDLLDVGGLHSRARAVR